MTADGYEEETLLVPVFSYFPVGSGSPQLRGALCPSSCSSGLVRINFLLSPEGTKKAQNL